MKLLIIAVLALGSLTTCSHRHKRHQEWKSHGENMTFEEAKTWKTQYLAKKVELIKQEQACIDVATDKPGLQKCTEDIRAKEIETMKNSNKQK